MTGRHAAVAVVVSMGAPSGIVALIARDRYVSALILGAVFAAFVLGEVVAFEVRDRRRARDRWRQQRAAGRPLRSYTPQTEDHYLTEVEYPNGRWAS